MRGKMVSFKKIKILSDKGDFAGMDWTNMSHTGIRDKSLRTQLETLG
jgi:hypothetical protein